MILDVIVQLGLQIANYPNIWYGDFRVWTTFGLIVSLGIVFAIQWLEHGRQRNPHGVALFFWLFLLVASAVKLRSLVSQQIYHKNLAYFVTYVVGFGLSVVEFAVEWLWPTNTTDYEAISEEEECPVEYATVFSLLTFSWMTPLMRLGYKQFLTEEDLWGLAHKDTTRSTGEAFDKAWESQRKHRKSPSLWITMFRAYGGPYGVAAIFKLGNDVSQFLQPQLLRYLISFVDSYREGEERQPVIKGAAIALAMFACACFQTAMIVGLLASDSHPIRSA